MLSRFDHRPSISNGLEDDMIAISPRATVHCLLRAGRGRAGVGKGQEDAEKDGQDEEPRGGEDRRPHRVPGASPQLGQVCVCARACTGFFDAFIILHPATLATQNSSEWSLDTSEK